MEESNIQEQIKPKKKWYKRWWGILLIVLFTIFLIFATIVGFMTWKIIKQIQSGEYVPADYTVPQISEEKLKIIEGTEMNYWTGSENPLVTIVEFSDFNCPLCKNSAQKIRSIVEEYKNEVKLIFRDFPVISDESMNLAMLARCAGEQGKFWKMHDYLFLNQDKINFENLKSLAKIIKLRDLQFKECFEDKKYLNHISKDIVDAQYLELRGTPTWFIDGNEIAGDISYENFKTLIESLIQYHQVNEKTK